MSEKIDKNIERKLFYHQGDTPPEKCPQCDQALVQETGPYQVATRSGRRLADEFVMTGKFGFLCPACATAVVHVDELARMLGVMPGKPGWKVGSEFIVIGLVNLAAIPAEQAHIPLDQLEPYPLVRFYSVAKKEKARDKKRPRKPKPKRRK